MTVRAIVVMGVSGSGKSTVGRALAVRLDGAFIDADDLHAPESVAKMRSGSPLTDDDRAPWLDRVGAAMGSLVTGGTLPIVACSALRRSYRDRLRAGADAPVYFVELHGAAELLTDRMASRAGHFMPATLLQSQMATLEALEDDESGLRVSVIGTPEVITETIAAAILAANKDTDQ